MTPPSADRAAAPPNASPTSKGPVRPLPLGWRLLEAWFQRTCRLTVLDDDPGALLAYNLCVHRGPEVVLKDATRVIAGDPVLELHFRREALLPLIQDGDPLGMALGLLKLGDRDFPRLALAVERQADLREVKALHALTLFHRGITRYGFEVSPMRERHLEWWFTAWHRLLMARDHAQGAARVREHSEKLVTRHIWLSREELLRLYGAEGVKRKGRGNRAP